MSIEEKFRQETGKGIYADASKEIGFSSEYVNWLEQQLRLYVVVKSLPTKDEIAEKAKERALKFNSVNEIGYLRHKNSFELGAEFVKEHLEKQK